MNSSPSLDFIASPRWRRAGSVSVAPDAPLSLSMGGCKTHGSDYDPKGSKRGVSKAQK
jgi:hypothetical protein